MRNQCVIEAKTKTNPICNYANWIGFIYSIISTVKN